uniref:Serpin domain-containing protein n=1 Tax=Panagrolaimus davidi TaxID=227884 RepID=A0A914R4R6_9BILA
MGENRDTIKIANKIYFEENLRLYESYEMNIRNFYNGNFQLTDFSNTQKATNEINKFVSDATNNEIQDIIDMVDENVLMILVNALYFERKWENPFTLNSSYTLFYSKPGVTQGLIMMSNEGLYNYAAKDNYEFLEIPYINNSFSMFIILPNEKYGLSEVLKSLKITEVLDLMFSTNLIQGNVTIPKFNVKSSFELSQVLKHLNIKDAFDEEMADFSGTTDSKISISRVLHKVIVKVDEKGTKAAAATVIEDILISYDEYSNSFTFNADHPFLYFIADKAKNIYFAGTFYD